MLCFPYVFCINLCSYAVTSQSKHKRHNGKRAGGKGSMSGVIPLTSNVIGKTPIKAKLCIRMVFMDDRECLYNSALCLEIWEKDNECSGLRSSCL